MRAKEFTEELSARQVILALSNPTAPIHLPQFLHGFCGEVARSLLKILPRSVAYGIIAYTQTTVHLLHVVVKYKGKYVDAYGELDTSNWSKEKYDASGNKIGKILKIVLRPVSMKRTKDPEYGYGLYWHLDGVIGLPTATFSSETHSYIKKTLLPMLETESYQPPQIDVGDEIKVGKFKNRKAEITGFKKDDNNQPVLKTTKGDQKLFKPRISKLMNEDSIPAVLYHATYKPLFQSIIQHGLGGVGSENKRWEDSIHGIVYLATTFAVAESYAESSETVPDEWLDEIIVLSIQTNLLDKSKLRLDRNVQDNSGDTYEYSAVIPFSDILK